MLPKLVPYWHDGYQRYSEPFMGSASLFFALEPPRALLSDINSELVETFIAVRDNPRAVHNKLVRIPLGKDSYYRIRALSTEGISTVEKAARFIFLNRFCFNGLYRTNMQGQFNVPFSSSRTGDLPSSIELLTAAKALRRADIRCADFNQVLDETDEGDFIYMDPPYAVANRRVFREYGPRCFSTSDLKRLSIALDQLDKRGVCFVVSYAFCKEALDAFRKWDIQKVFINRNIAGFAKHRRRAAELIVSNCQHTNSNQSEARQV
ncbi:MAG: Dam family site-specific DNA-(adenine-N6)-methyltransferase [Candidatus Latescibacteria bacterium]|nr:Dam family site-specific DNA-(adenine-N6)-methyltransferase [Candidatus Latescibacterota bacterium]